MKQVIQFNSSGGYDAIRHLNQWLKENPRYDLISLIPSPNRYGGHMLYGIVEIPDGEVKVKEDSEDDAKCDSNGDTDAVLAFEP